MRGAMRPLSSVLNDYVLDWSAAAWPIRWTEVFGREAPLVLEIGFGNGQFLVDQALAHPERDHVGVELSWSAATRLLKRLDKHRLSNVRMMLIDAEAALAHHFTSESLVEVFVNHPCPWPKARHVERRVLHPGMLAVLTDRMKTQAPLTVATDHAEYAAWLAEILQAQEALTSIHPGVETDAIPGRKPTKYERKALAQGIPIHYFEWRKDAPAAARAPSETHPEMPSLTLRGPYEPSSLLAEFEPSVFQEQHDGVEVVVRFGAWYRRADEVGWLVEVLLMEDQLRQEFGLALVPRREGKLLVKLSGLGRPHPTYGVKRAVWHMGHWLTTHHPGLERIHENLGAATSD
jgi:tRNA (guanine-N7-)-methyltransferase